MGVDVPSNYRCLCHFLAFLDKRGGCPFSSNGRCYISYITLYLNSENLRKSVRYFRNGTQRESVRLFASLGPWWEAVEGAAKGLQKRRREWQAPPILNRVPPVAWLCPSPILESSFPDFLLCFLSLRALVFGAGWRCVPCNYGSTGTFLMSWARILKAFSWKQCNMKVVWSVGRKVQNS